MNTAQRKLAAWSAAGLFGLGMAGYVALRLPRLSAMTSVSQADMFKKLSDIGKISDQVENVVAYPSVEKGLIGFNWSGKAPPKEPERPAEAEAPKPSHLPMHELVRVRAVYFDAEEPAKSRSVLSYTPKANVAMADLMPSAKGGGRQGPSGGSTQSAAVLKVGGDALDGPLSYASVLRIEPDGVVFGFQDGSRAEEKVWPNKLSLLGHVVLDHEDQVRLPQRLEIPTSVNVLKPPQRTTEVSPDLFQIGLEDYATWNESYTEILSSDVRYSRHRDPRTGRYDGIEIQEVREGSLAQSHGAKAGDVIKSINKHPVSSVQDAINFVKNNQDKYDVWEIEVVNKGQTKFIKYIPPQS